MENLEEITKKFERYSELRGELIILCKRYAEDIMLPKMNDKPSSNYEFDDFGCVAGGCVVMWFRNIQNGDITCRFVGVKNIIEHWDNEDYQRKHWDEDVAEIDKFLKEMEQGTYWSTELEIIPNNDITHNEDSGK